MIEIITQYAPWIITVVAVLGPQIPAWVIRAVNDKKLLNTFEDVKDLASNVKIKESDILKAMSTVSNVTQSLKNEIDIMSLKVNDEISRINDTILEFTDSEIYQKMLLGLNQLDELKELLKNKDTTIEQLGQVIKDIKKKLGD